MTSSNIKHEISTETIEDSYSEITVIERKSSDVFELARDHFSSMNILEYDTEIDYLRDPQQEIPTTTFCNAYSSTAKPREELKSIYFEAYNKTPKPSYEPAKRKTVLLPNKTGRCNCKQNLLANDKRKLNTTSASKFDTQTNDVLNENVDERYNINVPEISVKYSTSGIIKIPIEVRLSLKKSGYDTSAQQENYPDDAEPVSGHREWPSIKCIYQECCAWEYMEAYLDELLDGGDFSSDTHSKHGNDFVFKGECTEHYTEPYHATGYIYPDYEYVVPIDLDYVPPEYADLDKYPFAAEKISKKELSIEVDNDSRIHWEDVCLPPKGTVDIASAPIEPDEPMAPHTIPVPEGYVPPSRRAAEVEESSKKKKKSCKWFSSSCCGGEDDDDDDDFPSPRKQKSIVLLNPVAKTSLIYGQHCPENEPYTRQLLKAYPHHEKSDSPCSSITEIPWPKILLPEVVKIRSVDMIDLTEVKTEPSASPYTLCLCPDIKPDMKKPDKIPSTRSVSTNDLCICVSNKEHLKNLPDKLDVKPGIKNLYEPKTIPSKNTVSFCDNKLVTLYPPSNLPVVQSKSAGMIKTKLSGKSKSDDGIMRTKVTLSGKDLNRLLESQRKITSSNIINSSGYQKLPSKQICPASSQVSTSRSAPVLPKQEACVPETCPSTIKVESKEQSSCKSAHTIKADPVISALIACEAELKPVKQALNTVQQKLRNMNMPELDSIFSKGTELANVFLNKAEQRKCNCPTNYVSGYNPNTSMKPAHVRFMNDRMTTYAPPISSYPASYTCPSSTYMPQRPRPYVEQCPYYGQYQSSSRSQSSSCAPSVQNFSMRPNYDRNDLYPVERGPSKSAFRRPGAGNKQHVKYQRDQSEDWRRPDRSKRICCCPSSNFSSHSRIQVRKSEDEMTFTSSSSPSEDSMAKARRPRKRHRRLVKKVKSNNSGIVSRQSLCPFLEAMKSIMILDNKKTVKRGVNGVSYDTKLSTKNIKNMRMHMRVRTSKLSKK